MKKYVLLVISVLFILLSCISLSAAEPRIVRIGAFNFYPGIFKDTDGVVRGFYVDALADIAKRENIRFEYVYGSWSEGLERIKSGEVDVLTSVAFTEERAAFLDYTLTPLLTVWGELYTPLESEIDGISEVRGKKIAIMEGDYNARNFIELVKKFDIPCEFVSMPGFDDVFRAVAAHKADAGVVNNTFGAAKQKEYGLRSTGVVFNPFDIFFVVAKGKNQPLLQMLESNLANWRHQADSPFNKAREKWAHNGGIVTVIPRWIVTALVMVALLMTVAVVFVVVLKKQVRRKTVSIVESAEQYKVLSLRQDAILAAVPDIIMEVDNNKVYTWSNRAGLEFFGNDVIGKEAAYYFDDTQETYRAVRPLFEGTEQVVYVESWQRRKDGEVRLLAWWCKALLDGDGAICGTLSTARDITDNKQAENELRNSEESLSITLHSIADAVIATDADGRINRMNPVAERLTGWPIADARGKSLSEVFHIVNADSRAIVDDPVKRVLESGMVVGLANHTVLISRDEKEYQIADSAAPIIDKNGKIMGVVMVFSDVTERYDSEKTLLESEIKYRLLFEHMTSGFALHEMIYSAQGDAVDYRFLEINPAFEHLTGNSAPALIGRTVKEVMPDTEQYWIDTYADVVGTGRPITFQNYSKDLEKHFDVCAFSPSVGRFATVFMDITDQVQAAEELREYQDQLETRVKERTSELEKAQETLADLVVDLNRKTEDLERANEQLKEIDKLKSMFIASMSHELRTPLNSVIGFSSVLLNQWAGPINDEQNTLLATISRSGKHLLTLVNDVIDVSKIETGTLDVQIEDFDLNDIISEIVELMQKDAGEKGLELKFDAIHMGMRTDRRRLFQSVLNLASNAVKFTIKGSVQIVAKDFKTDSVEISVTDTGIGIRKEDMPKLFTAFVRLDSPLRTTVLGTGLGLYLTRKLVTEVLKGAVFADSRYEEGSSFTIRVPVEIGEQ